MCKPTIKTRKLTDNEALRKATRLGSVSVVLLVLSFSLTMPHLQSRRDSLGCDTMCYGSYTSARSLLSLVGSAIMGRFSDSSANARKICLMVGSVGSLVGMVIAGSTYSIEGMWLSMIPGALFQQNFSILKALLSDFSTSDSDRTSSVGMLGMAVGLAFMAGPLTGATLLKNYEQANGLGIVFCILSGVMITMLPTPTFIKPTSKSGKNPASGVLSFFNVKAARSPAAVLFMAIRTCMAMAFHVYQTIWTVSLKERFSFGPADHGKFMSFIGLTYALSQGFVAKTLLQKLGGNSSNKARVRIVLSCCVALGLGRYFAFQTQSLTVVYFLFSAIVTSLGIINTILTADTSNIASSDEIGSLFGILGAVESGAGMVGPIMGGALAYLSPIMAPLMAVVGLYSLVFLMVGYNYEALVLENSDAKGVAPNVADRKSVV